MFLASNMMSGLVSQVRLDFMGRVSPVVLKEGICSESVRNVGTGSTVFATRNGSSRKLVIGRIRGEFSCD